MKIDHDTDVEGFSPPSVFTLTGIVQQDDFLRPFDSNYDLAPRNRVDLGAAAPAPPPLLTIGDARAELLNNADLNAAPDFIRLGKRRTRQRVRLHRQAPFMKLRKKRRSHARHSGRGGDQ